MENSKTNTIGLETLERKLNRDNLIPFDYKIKETTEAFIMYTEPNPKYVSPVFSIQTSLSDDDSFENVQVVLISAAGATGKTELVKRLSYDMHCPVVDLGKTDVVAGNSLTGMLFKDLEVTDTATFIKNIQGGNSMLLIDALDEGYQKTNIQGYFDYLNDIISMLPQKGIPFVLLGRTNAIELATLYFDEKRIRTCVLKIEPFLKKSAIEFIDKQVCADTIIYEKPYKETRDYIIDSIQGFFKNQSSMKQYDRFIGYAPVLLAISKFLEKTSNYQQVMSEFDKNNIKEISLILDIVERILIRDKEQKVKPNLLERLVKGRSQAFKESVMKNVYNSEEQCGRILYTMLGEDFPYNKPTDDETFNIEYETGIKEWIKEHPFLEENKPSNIVFESYILASLISIEEYKEAVYKYLNTRYGNSYMFFYLYDELNKDAKEFELPLFPYLYASIKDLDTKNCYYKAELLKGEDDDDDEMGQVLFVGSEEGMKSYEYKTRICENDTIKLISNISDLTIDAPVTLELSGTKINLVAPSYIHCNKLIINTSEMFISSREADNEKFIIETECIEHRNLRIMGNKQGHETFVIVCQHKPSYPLIEYLSTDYEKFVKMTPTMQEILQKMRRMLLMFRSHSKGQLAKVQVKINQRIGNTDVGKKVIKALLSKGVICEEKHMYVIDNKAMNEFLGVKFDGIRERIISEKILALINDIVKESPEP